VLKRIDDVVHAHVIPSTGTLTKAKTKNQVRLELDKYFEDLMCIATSEDLVISVDTMHQYVIGLATLKTLMHMLSHELDRGAKSAYPNAIEARVRFQKYSTTECMDIIADYQAWHQFTTEDHLADVEQLVFP